MNQDSPLESYFESRDVPVNITIHFVIPPYDSTRGTEPTKEILEEVVNDFNKDHLPSIIRFYILQAKTNNDYQKINVHELENRRFYLHKDGQYIRDMVETLMRVEVGKTN